MKNAKGGNIMALFGFGKKKEEEKVPACACSEGTEVKAAEESSCCTPAKGAAAACCIKVLGSNCKRCHALLENAQAAVRTLGLDMEVEYITDLQKVMEYGVMSMPGLVINEQVVSMGKVLKTADIEALLRKCEA